MDDDGGVISYEEYHPYGTTAWWAEDAAIEVSRKRYRYTGKERDEETGLQYHSARYYAPWLGRWDRPDPIGLGDGGNRYRALRNSPALHSDPSGLVPPDGPSTDRAIGVPEEAIRQAQYYPFGEPGVVKPNGDFKVPVLTYDVAVVVFYTGDPEFDAAQPLHAHVQIAGVVETRAKANISVNATEIPMDASLLSDPAMFDATSLFFFPNSDDMSTVLRLAEQRGEVPPFILVISPGGIHVSDDQNSTYGGINIPRTPFMVVAGVWAVNEEGRTLEKGKFTASHEFGHKEGLWHTSLDDLCNTDVMQDPVHPFERHEAEFKDTQSDIMRRFAEEQQ
ncbi:RHS repeat-associated core domain-containing protein [Myxococcota bacterium]|nr:RHS repeat-associated core domain-containing protein [Myxococcota bacterium]